MPVLGRYETFREHGACIGLGPLDQVFGYGVAVSDFTLKAIGALITFDKPDLIRRLFKA